MFRAPVPTTRSGRILHRPTAAVMATTAFPTELRAIQPTPGWRPPAGLAIRSNRRLRMLGRRTRCPQFGPDITRPNCGEKTFASGVFDEAAGCAQVFLNQRLHTADCLGRFPLRIRYLQV